MTKSNFNEFRFKGFEVSDRSNKYWKINSRINETGDKIIVRYAVEQCFETAFGYGLRLGATKGIWLKAWQVSKVWDETLSAFVYEIVLDENFTKVAEFKYNDDYDDFDYDFSNIWESMKAVAKEQEITPVIWAK